MTCEACAILAGGTIGGLIGVLITWAWVPIVLRWWFP